jgi:hypothetical protein
MYLKTLLLEFSPEAKYIYFDWNGCQDVIIVPDIEVGIPLGIFP